MTLGELVAFAVPTTVWGILATAGVGDRVLLLGVVVAGGGEGAILGYAQSLALRRDLPMLSVARWVGATAAAGAFGWLVGMAPSTFHDELAGLPVPILVVLAALGVALLLCSIGAAQAMVLRAHVEHAGRWVIANALGWLAGLPVVMVALAVAPRDPAAARAAFAIAGGVGMGAMVAAVTGVFLLRLLREPRRGSPVDRARPVSPIPRGRMAYLDRLKVLLVAAIIAGHGVLGYSAVEGAWPYQEIREVGLADASEALLGMLVLPVVVFGMGLFFLIAGLLTPGSVARKGPRRFARDRLVRLGVPLAFWTLLLWPALLYAAERVVGLGGSYWENFVDNDPVLDTGPMWFVEVLLLYSLAYAAWSRVRGGAGRRAPGAAEHEPLPGRTLVVLAVAISVATCLIRPVFPFTSAEIGQSHLWQWPQYVAMFGLGIVGAQRGWLEPVPAVLRRRCGVAAALGVLAIVALVGVLVAAGLEPDVFTLRLHWAPLALAVIEGPLVIGASVWLLAFAQLHLGGPPGRLARALARSAFAAFIAQGVVLVILAVALRPLPAPAEVKALLVAGLGVAGSFGLAWLLVTRTALGRVL